VRSKIEYQVGLVSRSSAAIADSSGTSGRLLHAAQRGDSHAMGELVARYWPRLRRWAHGRLPRWVRTNADTTDLVQDAFVGALRNLDAFEPRSAHALAVYLRTAVRNRIRDEHRRLARRGPGAPAGDELAAVDGSPLDALLQAERTRRYRAALDTLSERDRELVVAHVELAYSHAQLGLMTGRSPNAARMALQRAVERLAAALES
jgi:RNA polymerase sigma factor (sigma-70 family)